MLETVEKIFVDGIGEIVAVSVTLVIAAIKRKLEKRKLRRKGVLRDEQYFKDDDYWKRY